MVFCILKTSCGQFGWVVLDWNENAIRFYKKLGAEVMDEYCLYHLENENIASLAEKLHPKKIDI
jgi:hypothetical protein